MRRSLTTLGIAAIAIAVAGCGSQRTTAQHTPTAPATAATSPAPVTSVAPVPAEQGTKPARISQPRPLPPAPTFTTPLEAMQYLAAAYNKGNLGAVKRVTSPVARNDLIAMRGTAVNLTLESCSRGTTGSYVCTFRHDFPTHLHRRGHGAATVLVAPADKPGWYMSALIDCD